MLLPFRLTALEGFKFAYPFPEGLGTNLLLGATSKNKLSPPKSEVGLSQPKEYSNYFAIFLAIKSSKKLFSLPND